MPKTYTVPPPPHHNEGKTVAAWTMNLGIVAGSVGIAVGMVVPSLSVLLWVGAAVVVLALLAGVVLSKAGLGQPRGYGHPQAVRTAGASADENARSLQGAGADAR